LAELDGEIAAGCILFECGGIVQAHLAGTKTRFMFQSPFHMVLYATFLWAKSRGNRYVHLGGGVGGAKDNLHRFKAGFSDHRFRFHTLRLVTDPQRYQELLEMRAMALGTKVEALLATGFFPAYRANGV
jgi:lipid II:glycine glycyltransferase (peptidoglycan interpeptide bridge formation enzyme)